LRRAAQFRLQAASWDRAFFDAVERNASAPIENVDLALFAGKDDGGNDARLGGKVDQGRLRAQIIVPDAHVDGLEAPDLSASLRIKSDERG